jgi:hypothetical protein
MNYLESRSFLLLFILSPDRPNRTLRRLPVLGSTSFESHYHTGPSRLAQGSRSLPIHPGRMFAPATIACSSYVDPFVFIIRYFLKAIKWARKYGLRINLDLHALPGSQNGWNHSGRLGTINMLNGPMGVANAQRSLDYIRVLAEFISQPQYKDVVTLFGITNEPQAPIIGQDALSR